jgi:hypothetical protein
MAKINVLDAPNLDTGSRGVVTGDANVASQKYEMKADAFLKIGQFADGLQQVRLNARDNDFYNKTVAESELEASNKFAELQKTRMNNPEGAAKEYNAYLNENIAKRAEGARTISERVRLEGTLTNQMVRYGTDATTWENNRQIAIYQDNLDAAIDAKLELAARSTDKADLDRLYGEVTGMVNGATAGEKNPGGFLPQENARVRLDKAKNIYSTGMEAMIVTNPTRAMQELQSGAWDKELNPIRKAKAMEMVQSRFAANAQRDRYKLDQTMDNMAAYVDNTGDIEGALSGSANPEFSLQGIESIYGEQFGNRVLEKLTEAKDNYDVRKEVFTTTPEMLDDKLSEVEKSLDVFAPDYAKTNQYLTKTRRMRQEVFGNGGDDGNSLIAKDPVAFVNQAAKFNHAPIEPTDFASIVAEQKKYGLNESRMGLIGVQQAQAFATKISSTNSVEEKVGIINGLRDQLYKAAGNAEQGDKWMQFAMNDMAKAGIDRRIAVVGMMGGTDVEAQRMGIKMMETDAKVRAENLSLAAKNRSEKADDVKLEVYDKLSDFSASYMARAGSNPDSLSAVQGVATMVAEGFYIEGDTAERAAEKAVNFITSKYDIVPQNGKTAQFFAGGEKQKYSKDFQVRFPKEINKTKINGDDVLSYANDEVSRIAQTNPKALIEPPTFRGNHKGVQWSDYVVREGVWVTGFDDKTLELQTPEGGQVMMQAGGRIVPVTTDIETAQISMNRNRANDIAVITQQEIKTNIANNNLQGLQTMRDQIMEQSNKAGQKDMRGFLPFLEMGIKELEAKRDIPISEALPKDLP